jgi:tetratricopeptide (TPR) repeat protein
VDEEASYASIDLEFAELERRMKLSAQRRPLEEKARLAQQQGEHQEAVLLWKKAQALATQEGEATTIWYVDGQLADALLRADRAGEAINLLTASIDAGSDIPFALGMLVDLLAESGRIEEAFRVQQRFWKRFWQDRTAVLAPDLAPQIVGFAKRWKNSGSKDFIEFAEQWAVETNSREALFAVRHERAAMLEKLGESLIALTIYLEQIRMGSRNEATYTRAILLLGKAKRADESLVLARSALLLGLSASFEEQTKKRIASMETKTAPSAKSKPVASNSKAIVPAFSIRRGAEKLRLLHQIDVKGGISSAVFRDDGAFILSGSPQGLWWIAEGADEATHVRAVPKRSSFYASARNVVVSDSGTVANGQARVEILGDDWATTAEVSLPGVTSQVAAASWGLAIGCRAGALHAIEWSGRERWRFEVPTTGEISGFGRACPYLVDSAPGGEMVVFSSFTDVYALRANGTLAWKWELVAPTSHRVNELISIQMASGSVSALRATRDGGAFVASQGGQIYRLDSSGRVTWKNEDRYNTIQLALDSEDHLVASVHSSGVAIRQRNRELKTVLHAQRWPTLSRAPNGLIYAASEGKLLTLLTSEGDLISIVEFSKTISDVALAESATGTKVSVAAGKLAIFSL